MIKVENSQPFSTSLLTSLWTAVTFLSEFLSTLFKEKKLKTATDNRTISEFKFIALLFVKLDVDQIFIFLNVDQQSRTIFQAYRYRRTSARFRDCRSSSSFSCHRRRSSIINANHRCQICDINSGKILFINDCRRSTDNSDRDRAKANKNDSSATFSVTRRPKSWLEVANNRRRIYRYRRRSISVEFWRPSLLLILWLQNFIWRNCAFAAYFVVLILLSTCPIAEACSTRPSAKPRPIRPVWSPDVTIQRENCTEDYAQLFCLNGGSCFRSKFNEHFVVGCKCARGWFGRRCEYNDIGDKNFLSLMRPRVESASVSLGVVALVLATFLLTVGANLYQKRRRRRLRISTTSAVTAASLDLTSSDCGGDCSVCQNSSPSVFSISRMKDGTSFDFQTNDHRSPNFVTINECIV